MDFVKSHLEKMKLWPVEHFWLTFFPDQHWICADLEKSEPKVFNWSEFHFSEVTSYKIHTLQGSLKIKRRKLCTYSTLLNIVSWTHCYLMKRNRLLKFPGMYFLILRSCGKISSWVSNLDQKFQHETAQWWSNDQGMFW